MRTHYECGIIFLGPLCGLQFFTCSVVTCFVWQFRQLMVIDHELPELLRCHSVLLMCGVVVYTARGASRLIQGLGAGSWRARSSILLKDQDDDSQQSKQPPWQGDSLQNQCMCGSQHCSCTVRPSSIIIYYTCRSLRRRS